GVILFPVACLILARDTLVRWRRRIPFDHHWWMRAFLVSWAAIMFAVLSWAGEKMPWLTVHIALPLILLGAALVGDAIVWLERRWKSGETANLRAPIAFGALLLL